MNRLGVGAEPFCFAEEFCDLNLGDRRLNKRFIKVIEGMSKAPHGVVQQSQKSWSNMIGAYRLLGNSKVKNEEILRAHREQTLARMSGYKRVIAIQDTSSLCYSNLLDTKGLGSIAMGGRGKFSKGILLHTTIAVTTAGTPLGLLDQTQWSRGILTEEDELFESERYRWHKGIKRAAEGNFTEVICVGDREADGSDFFAVSAREGVKFVVRAKERLRKSGVHNGKSIVDVLNEQPSAGEMILNVRTQKKQKPGDKRLRPRFSRKAKLKIRFAEIQLRTQASSATIKATSEERSVRAVLVEEINPPKGFDSICWLLFTNLKVNTFEQATDVLEIYKVRWEIENFHKILKSACNVEKAQLEQADSMKRLITILSIVAWRLHVLTKLQREDPMLACTEVLTEQEWQALFVVFNKSKNFPKKPPSIKQATLWIAQLGGFIGRKSDGEPGSITLWRGWKRLIHYTEMYAVMEGL